MIIRVAGLLKFESSPVKDKASLVSLASSLGFRVLGLSLCVGWRIFSSRPRIWLHPFAAASASCGRYESHVRRHAATPEKRVATMLGEKEELGLLGTGSILILMPSKAPKMGKT